MRIMWIQTTIFRYKTYKNKEARKQKDSGKNVKSIRFPRIISRRNQAKNIANCYRFEKKSYICKQIKNKADI